MAAPDPTRATVTATAAKNQFGQLLEKAMQGGVVVITKHDAPKAVMISMDEYTSLAGAAESTLNKLSAEFDSMLRRMQRPGQRRAMHQAFHASARAVGKAAVTAARKRV